MTLCCRRRIFLYIKNYLSSEDVMTKRSHLNVLSFIIMLIQVDIIKLLEPTVILYADEHFILLLYTLQAAI